MPEHIHEASRRSSSRAIPNARAADDREQRVGDDFGARRKRGGGSTGCALRLRAHDGPFTYSPLIGTNTYCTVFGAIMFTNLQKEEKQLLEY